MPIRIEADVLSVLNSATITDNCLSMPMMSDRKLYVRVNKVLEALGGKWNRSAKAHVFPGNPRDLIDGATEARKVVDPKQDYQFFPTPLHIAHRMVNIVNIKPTDIVLEPSAGHGAILDALLVDGVTKDRIRCCELMPANRQALEARDFTLIAEDFLTLDPADYQFDVIVANPPFTKGQDIDHVTHMWKVLKPGGRLVAITSPSWTFREDRKYTEFREWFRGLGSYEEELPEGTFADTNIRTMLILLEKERIAESEPEPVLTAPRIDLWSSL